MRTTRAALKKLGFKDNLLRHGIQREVFISFLALGGGEFLRTGKGKVDISELRSVDKVSALARERWIVPRSKRRPDYQDWQREDLILSFGRLSKKMAAELSRIEHLTVSNRKVR